MSDTMATLPAAFRPAYDAVVQAQEGHCLLCPQPVTTFGVWEQPRGRRIPYGLCAMHGTAPSQATLRAVEDFLTEQAWDPLPTPADGPLGYTRALEEQLALSRFLTDPKQWGALPDTERTMLGRVPLFVAGDAGEPLDVIPTSLARAQPYYWSAPLCAMLLDLAPTIPLDWTLLAETLVTPAGFNWLAAPLVLPFGNPAVTSFTWCRFTVHAEDVVIFTKFLSYPDRRAGFPSGIANWPIGTTLGMFLAGGRQNLREVDARRTTTSSDRPLAERLARMERLQRCYAAALVLLEQRILVPIRKPIPRPMRRRAARAPEPVRLPPGIDVVVFRRALQQHAPDGDGQRAIEWSCRWIVSGHWRQQWCPSLGRHRPTWILPHVKGPEDKPLKTSAKLFAVVR